MLSKSAENQENGRVIDSHFTKIKTEKPVGSRKFPIGNETIFGVGPDWQPVSDTNSTPWRAICHLEMKYTNGARSSGTGWLVSPDTVITAGHNVFLHDQFVWASSIAVFPGRSGTSSPHISHAAHIDALPGWINGQASASDLGMIKLKNSDLGHETGWLGVREMRDADLDQGPIVYSAGYPSGGGNDQWVDFSPLSGFDKTFVQYRLDTLPGNSGAPVLLDDGTGQWRVIATHVYGENDKNLGLRLNGEKFDAIANWINS